MPLIDFSSEDIGAMRDTIRRVRGAKFPGGRNTPTGMGTAPVRRWRKRPAADVAAPAVFRVVSSTQDGSNKRWTYSLMRVEKTSAGYGGWTDVSGAEAVTGYNVIEDQNGSSGTYGNGVVSTDLTGTFALKPVPNGTRIFAEPVAVGGETEWWFQYENGVTGAC